MANTLYRLVWMTVGRKLHPTTNPLVLSVLFLGKTLCICQRERFLGPFFRRRTLARCFMASSIRAHLRVRARPGCSACVGCKFELTCQCFLFDGCKNKTSFTRLTKIANSLVSHNSGQVTDSESCPAILGRQLFMKTRILVQLGPVYPEYRTASATQIARLCL